MGIDKEQSLSRTVDVYMPGMAGKAEVLDESRDNWTLQWIDIYRMTGDAYPEDLYNGASRYSKGIVELVDDIGMEPKEDIENERLRAIEADRDRGVFERFERQELDRRMRKEEVTIATVDLDPKNSFGKTVGLMEIVKEEPDRVQTQMVVPLQWDMGNPPGVESYVHPQWYEKSSVYISGRESVSREDVLRDRRTAMSEHKRDLLRGMSSDDPSASGLVGRIRLKDGTEGFGEFMDTKYADRMSIRWISLPEDHVCNASQFLDVTEYRKDDLENFMELASLPETVTELRLDSLIRNTERFAAYEFEAREFAREFSMHGAESVRDQGLMNEGNNRPVCFYVDHSSIHPSVRGSGKALVELNLRNADGVDRKGCIQVPLRDVRPNERTVGSGRRMDYVDLNPTMVYDFVSRGREPERLYGCEILSQHANWQEKRIMERVDSLNTPDLSAGMQSGMEME